MSQEPTDPKEVRRVLVTLNYAVDDQDGLQKVVTRFAEHGYRQVEATLPVEQLGLLIPGTIVKQLRDQYSNLERVVLLSNLRVFMLAWYRVFNRSIDGFFWFLDPRSPAARADSPDPVVDALANFKGVDRETLDGKIYTNATPLNCGDLCHYLLQGQNQRRFGVLEDFPWDGTRVDRKAPLNKQYVLADKTYDIRVDETDSNVETVSLDFTLSELPLRMGDLIRHGGRVIPFMAIALLEAGGDINHRLAMVRRLLQACDPLMDPAIKPSVADVLVSYADLPQVSYTLRVLLLTLTAQGTGAAAPVQALIRHTLMPDDDDAQYYALQCAACLEREHEFPEEYHRHKSEIYARLLAHWKDKIGVLLDGSVKRRSDRIAILTNQLDDPEVDPSTRALIERANELQADCPERKVAIFPADTFLPAPDDVSYDIVLSHSMESQCFQETHAGLTQGKGVGVAYVDPESQRKDRIVNLLLGIRNFEPGVVWCHDCGHELTRGLLHSILPIVGSSTGGRPVPDPADVSFDHLPSLAELNQAIAQAAARSE